MRSYCFRPCSNDWRPHGTGTDADAGRECHVKADAEAGARRPQAKDRRPATSRGQQRREGPLPRPFGGGVACRDRSLQDCEGTKHSHSSPGTLPRAPDLYCVCSVRVLPTLCHETGRSQLRTQRLPSISLLPPGTHFHLRFLNKKDRR